MIAYFVIAFFYGVYLYQTSVWNGYHGRGAHTMRGMTIFIAMCIWPVMIVIRFFAKRQ
jgi:hypothetical protein